MNRDRDRGKPPSPAATAATTPTRTFYQRELPPACIPFSSPEGKAVFASALARGGTHAFFPLIAQLQTQPEPAYCGLTTLVIVLNALAVDPRRLWKGPWRWYEESMLNCCGDLEEVKKTGITFSTFACLAKCQGLNINAVYGTSSTVEEFRRAVKQACTPSPGVQTQPTSFLIISYDRSVLGQTGTGHFSPIGAYDEASDRVLVLDTARFKYGPHWVPLETVFRALLPVDPDTGKSRGYAILGYDGLDCKDVVNETLPNLPHSVLFGSKKPKGYIRREYKNYIKSLEKETPGSSIIFSDSLLFWTKDFTDYNYVWELVEPQLQPVESRDIQMVESLRRLVKNLMNADKHASNIPQSMLKDKYCCETSNVPSCDRSIEISSAEVVYIVFLASLRLDIRRGIVYNEDFDDDTSIKADDTTREQLLAEAALISYTIETCDVDL